MSDLADAQQRARTRRRAAQMRQAKRNPQRTVTFTIHVPTGALGLAIADALAAMRTMHAALMHSFDGVYLNQKGRDA